MEQASLRIFDQLSTHEKVHAILGAVREPVSRALALDYAGIDYDNLGQNDQTRVDAIFNSIDVVITPGETPKYTLNEAARTELGTSVDMQSVNAQIANNLWDEMFPEE